MSLQELVQALVPAGQVEAAPAVRQGENKDMADLRSPAEGDTGLDLVDLALKARHAAAPRCSQGGVRKA